MASSALDEPLAGLDPRDAHVLLGTRDEADDPLLHFYERFLAAYAPDERRDRGVFYTPRPLVRFLVRACDALLRLVCEAPAGLDDLARAGACVYDPAAGTGTFLFEVLEHARARFNLARDEGAPPSWPAHARAHVRPFVRGSELLETPHALCLARDALRDDATPALRVSCADAFDEQARALTEGFSTAVVLGNPPYSARSRVRHAFAQALLRGAVEGSPASYMPGRDGSPRERNPKWLGDDYVKFLRLAQWHVERAGAGVVAFALPHGVLDQATFAGARAALCEAFDAVYAVDLHGNYTRRERAPDGAPDGNVFRVRSGICLLVLARAPGSHARRARVRRVDVYGAREHKLTWLDETEFLSAPWVDVEPHAPALRFTVDREPEPAHDGAVEPGPARGPRVRDTYAAFVSVASLFPSKSSCVVTGDDGALIAIERDASSHARRALYRPFDPRWIADASRVERPRRATLAHLWDRDEPPAPMLLARRQSVPGQPAAYVFAAAALPIDGVLRSDNRGTECVFLTRDAQGTPTTPEVLREALSTRAGLVTLAAPEALLAYVYGVLHTPRYRARYGALHAEDFPRVPLPENAEVFARVVAHGAALVALHTRDPAENTPLEGASFLASSDAPTVGPLRYDARAEQLLVAGAGVFTGVCLALSEHRVGSYRPVFKWLRDRTGRSLDASTTRAYLGVLGALAETQRHVEALEHDARARGLYGA